MNRSSLNGRTQILQGDKTSHGGVVIGGNPTHTFYGIPIARKGDKVTCPRCKPHIFEIAEGEANCTDTDAELPMAAEGHRTTCGAVLIAQQASASEIAASKLPMDSDQYAFDEKVCLKHDLSAGIPYYIELSDGSAYSGRADNDGQLPRIPSVSSLDYTTYWGDEALVRIDGENTL